jgi:hypothetical protein
VAETQQRALEIGPGNRVYRCLANSAWAECVVPGFYNRWVITPAELESFATAPTDEGADRNWAAASQVVFMKAVTTSAIVGGKEHAMKGRSETPLWQNPRVRRPARAGAAGRCKTEIILLPG